MNQYRTRGRSLPTGAIAAIALCVAACAGSTTDTGTTNTAPDAESPSSSLDAAPAETVAPAGTQAEPTATTASSTTAPDTMPAPPPTEMRLVVTGPEEIVFDWTTDRCEDDHIPDIATRVVRNSDGMINFYIGHETTRRMTGPDFDSLVMDCGSPVMTSDHDPDPAQFNDAEWIASTFTEDGETVYAIIHNEYLGFGHQDEFPGQCPEQVMFDCIDTSLTLGISTDGGATFSDALPAPDHLIATMPYTFDDEGHATGLWQTSNLVDRGDGYRYMLVNVAAYNANRSGVGEGWICAMRTDDVSDPTSWRYWDGDAFDGVFLDPYVDEVDESEVCAPVDFPALSAEMSESIIWVESIEKFVIVGGTHEPGDPSTWGTYSSTSDDLIDWSPRRLLMSAPIPATQPDGAEMTFLAYPTLIDPDSPSLNFDTSDGSMYLYNTRFNFGGVSLDRDLIRVPVAFEEHTLEPAVWDFDTADDAEGWRPDFDIVDFAVADGALSMTSTGDDPYLVNTGLRIPAQFDQVTITMAVDAGGPSFAEFFYLNENDAEYGSNKLVIFDIEADGAMHTYELDMSNERRWDGVITSLRLDPAIRGDTPITIDQITVGN